VVACQSVYVVVLHFSFFSSVYGLEYCPADMVRLVFVMLNEYLITDVSNNYYYCISYIQKLSAVLLLNFFYREMAKKSRAEIQRAYRERRDADPSRRQQYLQKEHNKYRKDVQCGKRKLVADIQSQRELRKVRKEWKNRQHDHRSRVALLKDTGLNTPPWSPESTEQGAHESRQRTRGRRIRRREKSAAYRRITQLEAELANAKRKAQRYQ